ncbi:hypothetical protein CYMTET_32144, partial [Cymbomonas tetramitiformis]
LVMGARDACDEKVLDACDAKSLVSASAATAQTAANEVGQLSAELEECHARLEVEAKAAADASQALEHTRQTVQRLENTANHLQQQISTMVPKQDLEVQENATREVMKDVQMAKDKLQETQSELEAQMAHSQTLRARLAEAKERLSQQSTQRDRLEAELKQERSELAHMAKRVQSMATSQEILEERERTSFAMRHEPARGVDAALTPANHASDWSAPTNHSHARTHSNLTMLSNPDITNTYTGAVEDAADHNDREKLARGLMPPPERRLSAVNEQTPRGSREENNLNDMTSYAGSRSHSRNPSMTSLKKTTNVTTDRSFESHTIGDVEMSAGLDLNPAAFSGRGRARAGSMPSMGRMPPPPVWNIPDLTSSQAAPSPAAMPAVAVSAAATTVQTSAISASAAPMGNGLGGASMHGGGTSALEAQLQASRNHAMQLRRELQMAVDREGTERDDRERWSRARSELQAVRNATEQSLGDLISTTSPTRVPRGAHHAPSASMDFPPRRNLNTEMSAAHLGPD